VFLSKPLVRLAIQNTMVDLMIDAVKLFSKVRNDFEFAHGFIVFIY
jgi:hypothetical protein